jgi:hypothetical protein
MRSRRHALLPAAGAVASLGVSLLSSEPSAAQANRTRIRVAYDAAEGCPSREMFVARLSARTQHFELAPADPRATTYRITLRSGDGAKGRVESEDSSGAIVVEELPGETCAEVADALALVVALAIDARAPDANIPATAPPDPPVPPPAPPAPSSDRPASRPSVAPRWAVSSTVGALAEGPFLGPEAFLELALVPAA